MEGNIRFWLTSYRFHCIPFLKNDKYVANKYNNNKYNRLFSCYFKFKSNFPLDFNSFSLAFFHDGAEQTKVIIGLLESRKTRSISG